MKCTMATDKKPADLYGIANYGLERLDEFEGARAGASRHADQHE
jgi:hypothetical protein